MRDRRPWFKFWHEDFWEAEDVRVMSAEGVALYLLLLTEQWKQGPLRDDAEFWRKVHGGRFARFEEAWEEVRPLFELVSGRLVNARLEAEREDAEDLSAKRSAAGRGGARRKWGSAPDAAPETAAVKRARRLRAAREKGRHDPEEWQRMLAAYGRCLACGATGKLVKDHIKPIYQGGSDGIWNIQPLCRSCNSRKGGEARDLRVGLPETDPAWLTPGKTEQVGGTGLPTEKEKEKEKEKEREKKTTRAPARGTTRKRAPSGPVQEALTVFSEAYLAVTGEPYPIGTKDAVQVAKLVKKLGDAWALEAWKGRIAAMAEDQDPFARKNFNAAYLAAGGWTRYAPRNGRVKTQRSFADIAAEMEGRS